MRIAIEDFSCIELLMWFVFRFGALNGESRRGCSEIHYGLCTLN